MDTGLNLRQSLWTTVLGTNSPSGKPHNAVNFAGILLSLLLMLLEPDAFGNSALRQTSVPWVDLVQKVCLAVFAADFGFIWPWLRNFAAS